MLEICIFDLIRRMFKHFLIVIGFTTEQNLKWKHLNETSNVIWSQFQIYILHALIAFLTYHPFTSLINLLNKCCIHTTYNLITNKLSK